MKTFSNFVASLPSMWSVYFTVEQVGFPHIIFTVHENSVVEVMYYKWGIYWNWSIFIDRVAELIDNGDSGTNPEFEKKRMLVLDEELQRFRREVK